MSCSITRRISDGVFVVSVASDHNYGREREYKLRVVAMTNAPHDTHSTSIFACERHFGNIMAGV